jgi:hypothetical protein
MSFLSVVTRPRLPHNAVSIGGQELAAVELRRRAGRFVATNVAYEVLPPGLCVPSFERLNIPNPEGLAAALDRVAESAGLSRRQRWSAVLPEAVVRTLVVSLDSVPSTRDELNQVLDWKTERLTATPIDELRVGRHFISAGRSPRFLIVAARKSVIAEYEGLFTTLDWKVGLIVPRFVSEVSWLDWDSAPGDKLVIGSREGVWTAAFVRGGEVLLVRPLDDDQTHLEDEIYRLALYYRDRIAESPDRAVLTRLMTCGPVDGSRLSEVIGSALGTAPGLVNLVPELLEVDVSAQALGAVASAAGIASQAWAH